MELRKSRNMNKKIKMISILTPIAIILVLVVTIRLNNPGPQNSPPLYKTPSSSTPLINPPARDIKVIDDQEKCDIFTGEWIPNPAAPYYTNKTCWAIHEHQNCMKYGRPDSDFMKWRWKPDGCDLPLFNPFQFLDIVRGKSLAFVGDSVGRNQMQSMICLLSRVMPLLIVHHPLLRYFGLAYTLK